MKDRSKTEPQTKVLQPLQLPFIVPLGVGQSQNTSALQVSY